MTALSWQLCKQVCYDTDSSDERELASTLCRYNLRKGDLFLHVVYVSCSDNGGGGLWACLLCSGRC